MRARMRYGKDLDAMRSREMESLKAAEKKAFAANVLIEESEITERLLEIMADDKRSPWVKKKLPLWKLDPATAGLDESELDQAILKFRPGLVDKETGKPTEDGQHVLKLWKGETAITYRDPEREALTVAELGYMSKHSDAPEATMAALANVLERFEASMDETPGFEDAVKNKIQLGHSSQRMNAPATTSTVTGKPGEFGGWLAPSKTTIDRTEDSQIRTGQAELDSGRSFSVADFNEVDPQIIGDNVGLRSAVDEGLVRVEYARGEDGNVTGVSVVPTTDSQRATSAADILNQRVSTNQSVIERMSGLTVNKGTMGEADIGDMGAAVTSPEAAAIKEEVAPEPEPQKGPDWMELQRQRIRGNDGGE